VASTRKVQWLTIAASLAFHAALLGALSWLAFHTFSRGAPDAAAPAEGPRPGGAGSSTVSIELPTVGDGILVEDRPVDPTGDPPRLTGGDTVAHPDEGHPGHGGQQRVPLPALNLADQDEHLRLSPDLLSRIDRDQLQRLRVASRARQSWEDRRSTPHPQELTFVVTGPGSVLERRPRSAAWPSRGALESPRASVRGGDLGQASPDADVQAALERGGARSGSLASAPGAGLLDARAGRDHRTSAPIGSARPAVKRAFVAVPARESGRPRDDVDSEQEVATTVRSLVHASTAGGALGEGQGGNGGGGEAGSGASAGTGSRARPLGAGTGDVFDYWTSDPRLLPYFRQLHARIDPLWANAFPKSALFDLKQGTVILVFTIHADGRATLQWPPARPSGIDAFDRNCAEAIRRAAPFPPIPASLGVRSLTIRAPFVASNPMVK